MPSSNVKFASWTATRVAPLIVLNGCRTCVHPRIQARTSWATKTTSTSSWESFSSRPIKTKMASLTSLISPNLSRQRIDNSGWSLTLTGSSWLTRWLKVSVLILSLTSKVSMPTWTERSSTGLSSKITAICAYTRKRSLSSCSKRASLSKGEPRPHYSCRQTMFEFQSQGTVIGVHRLDARQTNFLSQWAS